MENMKIGIKFFLGIIFLLSFLFLSSSGASALRKRTRKPKGGGGGGVSVSQGVTSYVRFRGDRQALLIDFSGFQNVDSVSYELIYDANGVTQGVSGSIPAGDTDTKTLLFGTCSGPVCTYHQDITNMRLSIISVLDSGIRVLKPYRIRV